MTVNLFKLDISQLRLLRISSDNLTAFTSPRILKLIIKSPSFDLKPKWLPDEKVVATKLGYEHKDTGEVLVSFASVGGLPNAEASVFMQLHHLKTQKTVAPKPTGELLSSVTPTEILNGEKGEAPSSDISKETLDKVDNILNPKPATPVETQPPAQPVVPAETATSGNTIRFTFERSTGDETSDTSNTVKLKSVISSVKAGDPEGWTGAFVDVDGHKAIRTLSSEGKGTRFIESEGISSDGSSDIAMIVPFRMSAGGSTNISSALFGRTMGIGTCFISSILMCPSIAKRTVRPFCLSLGSFDILVIKAASR